MADFALLTWVASIIAMIVFWFRRDWPNVKRFATASVLLSILIVVVQKLR